MFGKYKIISLNLQGKKLYLNTLTENYCSSVSDSESNVLNFVNRDTFANVLKPRMLSGHLQGRFLAMISNLIQPKAILEIGTFTGYSTICLAEGLAQNGKITTIEANEELKPKIERNFELAGITEKVNIEIGEALEIIPKLNEKFDLVFIDADKKNYLNYYNLIFEKLNMGGVILSDNVLWSGKIIDETQNDATTEILRKYNLHLKKDKRTQKVLIPIRDGVFISRKISEL